MLCPTSSYYEDGRKKHDFYDDNWKSHSNTTYRYENSGLYPRCVVALDNNFKIIDKENWRTGSAKCRQYIKSIATNTKFHCCEVNQLYLKCTRRSFLRAIRKEREYSYGLGIFLQPHLNFGRIILCNGQRDSFARSFDFSTDSKMPVMCCCGIKFQDDDQLRRPILTIII